ncbi:hypothetical protein ABEG18_05875 [Alsobacter sp. KACC 23698]|uniref:Uncharacterized protein n=1 Tax=Alsobacter sp. KACC 23698 TaxID=3149229 RepID=A0AAU7JJ76_9HYPH
MSSHVETRSVPNHDGESSKEVAKEPSLGAAHPEGERGSGSAGTKMIVGAALLLTASWAAFLGWILVKMMQFL